MTKSEFWRQAYLVVARAGRVPGDCRSWADSALRNHEQVFPGVLTDDPPRDGAHTSTGASPYACPQCGSVSACDHVPF